MSTTPERGICGYIDDMTQGPACSVAACPATLYRNYLIDLDPEHAELGQRKHRQINNLCVVEDYLKERFGFNFWTIINGYTRVGVKRMQQFEAFLQEDPQLEEEVISRLCVGIQRDTEVTIDGRDVSKDTLYFVDHTQPPPHVTQVFCSAMS